MYNQLTDKVPMNARPTFTGAIPNNVINQGFKTEPEMTTYHACEIIEGFGAGLKAGEEDKLKAISYLVKTGECWSLQGMYGRIATQCIASGLIDRDGNIIG